MAGEIYKGLEDGLEELMLSGNTRCKHLMPVLADREDVCADSDTCGGCVEIAVQGVLDALEDAYNAGFSEGASLSIRRGMMPDGMEWPRFEDGALVRVGDVAEFKYGVATVTGICFDGELAWVGGDFGSEAISFRPGESVKRPEPHDTQERIDADATVPPKNYCCERNMEDMSGWDDSQFDEWKVLDLLRRQRKLDGRKS